MTEARVFVVNEPIRNVEGRWGRAIDLTPAERHGRLIFLSAAGRPPEDLRPIVDQMWDLLVDFDPAQDFLLPIGDLRLISYASAIVGYLTGGDYRLLNWDGRDRTYEIVAACPFDRNEDPETTGDDQPEEDECV
jgi:hypothetical protein